MKEEKQYRRLFLAGVVNGVGDRFSSVANRLRKHLLVIGLAGLLAEGALLVALSRTHFLILAMVILCGVAFVSGISNTCFDSVLMKEIPKEHQGMAFGWMATISNTILGVSMFLAGLALQYVTPRSLGMIGGSSYVLIASFLLTVFSAKSSGRFLFMKKRKEKIFTKSN